MKLGFGQVTAVLERLLGIDPAKTIAFKGRLKHFQRAKFPPGTAVGRGPRAAYGLDELFGLVFAFELCRMRVPPAVAARTVTASWPTVRQALLLAWAGYLDDARSPDGNRGPLVDLFDDPGGIRATLPSLDDGPFYLVCLPDGLEDLRRPDDGHGLPDRLTLVDQRTFWRWFRTPAAPANAIQFIDSEQVVRRVLDLLLELGMASLPALRDAFHQLRLVVLAQDGWPEVAGA